MTLEEKVWAYAKEHPLISFVCYEYKAIAAIIKLKTHVQDFVYEVLMHVVPVTAPDQQESIYIIYLVEDPNGDLYEAEREQVYGKERYIP